MLRHASKRTLRLVLAGAVAAAVITVDTFAHHSTSYFDGDMVVTITGQVARFDWRSPHCYVHVQTTEPGVGVVTWRFESVPTPIMSRQGWNRDSLKVGDQVTVQGYPLRDRLDERYAWLKLVTKSDGTVLDPGATGRPMPRTTPAR